MHNRRTQHRDRHEPLLGAAFDDWIEDDAEGDAKALALIHFMAGASSALVMIREAHGSGRFDAASRIFNELLVEVHAFKIAAERTAAAMEEEMTR